MNVKPAQKKHRGFRYCAGLVFSLRSIFVHDTPDHGNQPGEGWPPSHGNRTPAGISCSRPCHKQPDGSIIVRSGCHRTLQLPDCLFRMDLGRSSCLESSRILWSCSRGSADPGTKVPDDCVFSCQYPLKRNLSSPIGHFSGKNCTILENFF